MAVANGHASYMPPQRLRKFENDLEAIPLWLATGNDMILTRNSVDTEFTDTLSRRGIALPRFIQKTSQFDKKNISELHPWGWSPAAHKHLEAFKAQCSQGWNEHHMSTWKDTHKELLSRLTGLKLSETAQANTTTEYNLLEIPANPLKISSPDQFHDIQNSIPFPILLKAPWSASGRGLFKIGSPDTKAFTNLHLLGKLKQQGFLMAEPFLEKIHDVSFHFWSSNKGIHYLGYSFFKTDPTGQFLACYLNTPKLEELKNYPLSESLEQAKHLLKISLQKMKIDNSYHGPIGIDGLFFRNSEKAIKLQPCIEINLRYTMGLLNIKLREKLQHQGGGFWQIVNIKRAEWDKLANEKSTMSNGESICREILPLTPPPKQSGYMACLKI